MAENEKKGSQSDVIQDWLKTQEKLLDTWKESMKSFQPEGMKNMGGDSFEQMLKEWQNNQKKVLDLWKGQVSDFSPNKLFDPMKMFSQMGGSDTTKNISDFYQNWYENYNKMFENLTQMFPSQVGKETFEKMMHGGQVYSSLHDFWNKYIKDFINTPNASLPENFSQMPKEWLEDYNKVLNNFFQQGFGEPFNSYVQSTTELADAYRQSMESFLSPWMDSSDELSNKALNALKGDKDAFMEFMKEWDQAFHDSYGKMFNIPGFGLGKEQSEKLLQSMEAYLDYNTAINEFIASLQKVGYDVMDKLMHKIMKMKEEGNPPETFKEFYDMWVSANEKAYLELFSDDSFAKMLGEVVDAGAKFKKRYDEVIMDNLRNLPIPTDHEMDTVYSHIYELKKEVREMKKELEELKKGSKEK